MNKQRMQRWRAVPPKPISVRLLQQIIESLDNFMLGLETIERVIETKVAANGVQNVQSGPDSWKAYQPFALDKIAFVQFELTLKKNEKESCQLHVEFQRNRLFISVSDIGTGWLDAVFEEMERNLKSVGLFEGELKYKLTSTISHLQNIFLVGGTALLLFPEQKGLDLFYVGMFFVITGVIPVLREISRVFFPQKPIQVLEERVPLPSINIVDISIWVSLISGIVALFKEVFILVSTIGG